MYSLSKLDPMTMDPEQIRVAIRVNESVNATQGSAQIITSYKTEDGSMSEEHTFNVQLTNAQTLTPKLTRGLLPGEQVTVMSLTPEDAHTMRGFQKRLIAFKSADVEGTGSFTIKFGKLCLDKEMPEDDVPLTLFVKTETNEDYIIFIKTNLNDLFSDTDNNIDQLPFCEGTPVGGASSAGREPSPKKTNQTTHLQAQTQ